MRLQLFGKDNGNEISERNLGQFFCFFVMFIRYSEDFGHKTVHRDGPLEKLCVGEGGGWFKAGGWVWRIHKLHELFLVQLFRPKLFFGEISCIFFSLGEKFGRSIRDVFHDFFTLPLEQLLRFSRAIHWNFHRFQLWLIEMFFKVKLSQNGPL